jgi:hypothetical protein
MLWANRYRNLDVDLENATEVVLEGDIDSWVEAGKIDLKPWEVIVVGDGDHAAAVERLRSELEERGWFDDESRARVDGSTANPVAWACFTNRPLSVSATVGRIETLRFVDGNSSNSPSFQVSTSEGGALNGISVPFASWCIAMVSLSPSPPLLTLPSFSPDQSAGNVVSFTT